MAYTGGVTVTRGLFDCSVSAVQCLLRVVVVLVVGKKFKIEV